MIVNFFMWIACTVPVWTHSPIHMNECVWVCPKFWLVLYKNEQWGQMKYTKAATLADGTHSSNWGVAVDFIH